MKKLSQKERASLIGNINAVSKDFQDVICQLESGSDSVYCELSETVQVLQCFSMEFSVGVDPRDGKKKFKLYHIG